MRTRTTTTTLLALALFSAACAKTAEKEDARFTRAQANVDKLAAVYPSFAGALTAQKKKAQDAMAAAKKVSDEKQRIEAMSDANDLLTGGFVRALGDVDGAEKKLRRKMTDATRQATTDTLRLSAKQASDSAERVLASISERLKTGAKDAAAAKAVLDKVSGDIREAERNLDRVLRDAKAAAKASKPAAGASGATGTAGAAGTAKPTTDTKAEATWTCAYCGRTNHADKLSCEGCGAAKAAPSDKKKKR